MHHFHLLEVFEDGHIEVQIFQSVREIFAVHICASPARKDKERRRREETIVHVRTDQEVQFRIFLPALQRRDFEIFVVEDQGNTTLSVIHVVL